MVLKELTVPDLSLETAKNYSRHVIDNYINQTRIYLKPRSLIINDFIQHDLDNLFKRDEDIIIPFSYTAKLSKTEASNTSDGQHWIIQPNGSSVAKLIVNPDFKLQLQPVYGKGWFLGWKRGVGVKKWEYTKKSHFSQKVIFDHNWLICLIAHPKELFIVEGVNTPHYDESFETEVEVWKDPKVTQEDGTFWCGIPDYWHEYNRLKTKPGKRIRSIAGR